jgi:hypothetical protein
MLNPWVGERYGKRSLYRLKLLIVGESHYQWRESGVIQNGTPKRAVRDWIKGWYGHSQFGRELPKAFWGGPLSDDERHAFWHSVAFTNYVQENVPLGSRRPSLAMWREGAEPFIHMVKDLAPNCIIVASRIAWNSYLPDIGSPGRPLRTAKGPHDTWLYPISKTRTALTTWLPHPSRRDFRYKDWHPILRAAINHALVPLPLRGKAKINSERLVA